MTGIDQPPPGPATPSGAIGVNPAALTTAADQMSTAESTLTVYSQSAVESSASEAKNAFVFGNLNDVAGMAQELMSSARGQFYQVQSVLNSMSWALKLAAGGYQGADQTSANTVNTAARPTSGGSLA